MTVYLAIKYHADLRNRELIEGISSRLESLNHKPSFALRDLEHWGELELTPQELMKGSFALIDTADVVLIELSEKGVGLGIEAGYAHALGKRIVVLAQAGSDISTTLKGVAERVLFYDDLGDLERVVLSL